MGISPDRMAMVKSVITRDWQSARAIALAISRPIYLSGSAKLDSEDPVNNGLKLKEI